MLRGRPLTRRVAVDEVGEHNRRMWERLAEAGIPYTRPQGKPPRDARGKRRFLDDLTHGRLRGADLDDTAGCLKDSGSRSFVPTNRTPLCREQTFIFPSLRRYHSHVGQVANLAGRRAPVASPRNGDPPGAARVARLATCPT